MSEEGIGVVVVGIDPGLRITGFGVVRQNIGRVQLLDCGYLRLSPTKTLSQRIELFYEFLRSKVAQWGATDLALETPFLGKNAQNFLKLGYLRGVAHLVASQQSLVVHEFSPCEVKRAVTGFGGAQKDQVARVIMQLFPRLGMPAKNDVTDAIAVTLCGMFAVQHGTASARQSRR